jgi:hypothetical protein
MTNTQAFSRHIVSEVCSPPRIENRFAPGTKEGAERRKAHPTRCRAASNQRRRRSMPSGAAARTSGARSPSGALLRLSPGLSTPDSAPGHASWNVVQAGATRPRLSQSSDSTSRLGRSTEGLDARSRPAARQNPLSKKFFIYFNILFDIERLLVPGNIIGSIIGPGGRPIGARAPDYESRVRSSNPFGRAT